MLVSAANECANILIRKDEQGQIKAKRPIYKPEFPISCFKDSLVFTSPGCVKDVTDVVKISLSSPAVARPIKANKGQQGHFLFRILYSAFFKILTISDSFV